MSSREPDLYRRVLNLPRELERAQRRVEQLKDEAGRIGLRDLTSDTPLRQRADIVRLHAMGVDVATLAAGMQLSQIAVTDILQAAKLVNNAKIRIGRKCGCGKAIKLENKTGCCRACRPTPLLTPRERTDDKQIKAEAQLARWLKSKHGAAWPDCPPLIRGMYTSMCGRRGIVEARRVCEGICRIDRRAA